MKVKARTLILLLLVMIFAFFLTHVERASAQEGDPVRVITLSKSGYERGHALAFSPDGKYLVVGGLSGIYIFDYQKLSELNYLETNTWARSLAFLPGTDTLAAGLFDNTIKLWDVPSTQLFQTLDGPQGWVRSISVSGDGSLIASASDDDMLHIWDLNSGGSVLVLSDEITKGIRAVALSPDGKLVAGAPGDNTIRVWSLPDGKLLHTLTGHTDWVRCLAFSPDSQLLASGAFDKTVRLWNLSDDKEVHVLLGHTSSVLGVAFSPDGTTLASGSVDETVRLWQVGTGDALQVLRGHTDFVYAVAFSPDGKTLASGGGDNSVRIWDLGKLDDIPTTSQVGTEQITPSDCRACHHRRGLLEPARVIELSCEGCHAGGISLSWCAAFPRAGSFEPIPAEYHGVLEVSGVPLNDREIAVAIVAPGNGETLYVRGDYLAPETISGQVFYAVKESITKVEVQLDIMSGGHKTASLVTNPSQDGQFSFGVDINPDSPPAYATDIFCRNCHGRVGSGAGLSRGDVKIIVTATAPDGEQAFDERWLRVDSSKEVVAPIHVVDDMTGKPIADILVEATTVLYQWRARTTGGTSDVNGNVALNLESLSQSPTLYQVTVPSQIVNGVLYKSNEIAQFELEPSQTSFPTMSLKVHGQTGRLTGEVTGNSLPEDLADVEVWAVQLPGGPVYKAPLDVHNTFTFSDFPISRYLVFADPFRLASRGLGTISQKVDLLDSPDLNIALELVENHQYSGTLVSKDGKSLPFAWITVGGKKQATPLYPISDEYQVSVPPSEATYLTFSAPGYYSLSKLIDLNTSVMNVQLVPRPETQSMPWGNGQVVIPPETSAAVLKQSISIGHGWLWGSGGSSQPLLIRMSDIEIAILQGDFALEAPVGGTPWLYLYEGTAQVTYDGVQSSTELSSGQMIALVNGASPLPLDQSLITGLHPALYQLPISEIIEPSLKAQFENRLLRMGINIAQVYTFVAYILSIGVLIAIPVFMFIQKSKKPRKPSHNGRY
jgi:WD40 repeat protein